MAEAMVSKFPCILTSLEAPIVSFAKLQATKHNSILSFVWSCLFASLLIAAKDMKKNKEHKYSHMYK